MRVLNEESGPVVAKEYPEKFRRDAIAVARKGEAPIRQIVKDFGISEMCLQRWLWTAARDDGLSGPKPAAGSGKAAELREARKQIRLLDQENEILRKAAAYPAQSSLSKGSSRWSLTLQSSESLSP